MSGKQEFNRNPGDAIQGEDPALDAVLSDFRASVHAWSDATYRSRMHAFAPGPHRTLWRRSLVWAVSLVLAAGVATGGIQHHHQQELARHAEINREIEHQRQLAKQHAQDVDELLAKVDSEVSRQVPSAMEPLASLMADDNTQ